MDKEDRGQMLPLSFFFWVKTGSGRYGSQGWGGLLPNISGAKMFKLKKGAKHMNIEMRKTDDLIPYENNPRKNDGAVEAVANSIKEFGFKVPIIVDAEGVIVAGHTRLKAAQQLGLEEVPVVVADDLTEEQVKAFRLADNKTAEQSSWEQELLDMELEDIENIDMTLFGFDGDVIEIDDIDQYQEAEMPIARELGEANNYIVLEFMTETDWEDAQLVFGLERVQTGDKNKNIRRYGIGHVIDGAEVLGMVRNED